MDDHAAVSEIMSRIVLTASPDDRLITAARRMRQAHVSGLPVLDPDQRLVGVISDVDLVRGLHRATGVVSPRGLLDLLLASSSRRGRTLLEACQERLRNGRVRDLMTRRVTTLDPAASIREAARLMQLNGIHRLPIVEDSRRLLGIVSHVDLLRAISGRAPGPRGSLRPTDRSFLKAPRTARPALRTAVEESLRDT